MNPLLMFFLQALQGQQPPMAMQQNPFMTGAGGYNMSPMQFSNPYSNYLNQSNNFGFGQGGSIFSPFTFNPFPFNFNWNPFNFGPNPFAPPPPIGGHQNLPGRPMDGVPTGRTIATDIPIATPGIQPMAEQPTFEPTLENKPRPVRPVRNDPNAQGIRRY